jgi:rod shape-determining protein MreD
MLILLAELILQSTFFPLINIGGYAPDLVLVTLLVIGVFYEKEESWKYGWMIGLIKDVVFGTVFGVFSLVYLATVLVISNLGASIFKENVVAPLLMFPVGIVVSNGLLFLFRYLLGIPSAMTQYLDTWSLGYWVMNLVGMILMYGLFKQLRQRGFLLDPRNM